MNMPILFSFYLSGILLHLKNLALLFSLFVILIAAPNIYGQDEAYSNETRDYIFDSGGFYYGLGYGTDFTNRKRLSFQYMVIRSRNIMTGWNLLVRQDENNEKFAFGYGVRNYFMNGNIRPFVELQMNLYLSPVTAEWSGVGGLSYFIDMTGGSINIDLYGHYYEPIFTDLEGEKGLIPSLRIGYLY